MAKDVTSKKLNDLDKRIEQLKAQKMAEEARLRKKARADETRRKILIGAYYLEQAEKKEGGLEALAKRLDGFLVRKNDRLLFGLSEKQLPKPDSDSEPETEK